MYSKLRIPEQDVGNKQAVPLEVIRVSVRRLPLFYISASLQAKP